MKDEAGWGYHEKVPCRSQLHDTCSVTVLCEEQTGCCVSVKFMPPPVTFLYAAQAKDPGVIFDASLSSQFTSSPLTLVLSAVSSHTSRVRPSLISAFAFCLLNLISQETL